MSKIGNFTRLPVTVASENLCEATEDINSNSVILTQTPKFVSVVNVGSNSIIKEWTLHQKNHITGPVVVDRKTKRYVALTDHMVLKTWDNNDSKIGKAKQSTLTKDVEKLVCVGEATVIVFKDGSLASYQEQVEYFGKTVVKESDQILQCEGYIVKDAIFIVLIIKKTGQPLSSINTCVYRLNMKEEMVSCLEAPLLSPESSSKYVASCIQCRQNQLLLIVLWSDGHMSQVDVTDSSLETQPLINLSHTLTSSLGSMVTLNDTQLAILGVNDETNTVGLGIWDTSFGIMQAWAPLPDLNISKAKLHRHKNRLLLLSDKGLYSCSFVAMTTTISSVLGCLKDQSVNTDSTEAHDLVQIGEQLLKQSGKQFDNTFAKFMDQVERSAECKLLARSLVSRLVSQWVSKTGTESKYSLPDKVLTQLVEGGLLTARDFDRLLPVLTEHRRVCLVYRCLSRVPDVSEAAMCKALAFYLSCFGCEDNRLEQAADELELCVPHKSDSTTNVLSVFLNQILCMPFNDVFLLQKLKNLSFTQVMVLMNYLHERLIQNTEPKTLQNEKDSPKEPSLSQVIDWLNLLIDAHCTQLILSQETKAVVIELHQLVETRVEFFRELDALEAVLFQLKEKHTVPQRKTVGPYCIETLHIL